VCDLRRAADDDDGSGVRPRGADFVRGRDQFFSDQALAALEPPALLGAAQLLGGHRLEFQLDLVEVCLQLGYGARR
jgi:hypothetical protein